MGVEVETMNNAQLEKIKKWAEDLGNAKCDDNLRVQNIRVSMLDYLEGFEYEPKSTPAGRWVECEVSRYESLYTFKHPFRTGVAMLHDAPGMVGFGGVRYVEQGAWMGLDYCADDDDKPLKPIAVRFWVEG
jgi:hypothetical protein